MKQTSLINSDSEALVFVIHKHDATSLHFDFRLQVGHVMSSWAIPKGPTLDPKLKRLAMATTDHPLEYRHFEGVLPEGSYGAGPVLIWDRGIYYPEMEVSKGNRERVEGVKKGSQVMREGIKKGEIKFCLLGEKLKGSFALVKTHGFGGKNAWLLIKHKDEFIIDDFNANDKKYDYSVMSRKTLEEIAEEEGATA